METAAPPALPPHKPTEATGFDVDADVSSLKNEGKEDYSSAWTQEPKPDPPPAATDQASGGSSTEAPGTDAPKAEPINKDSAEVMIKVYDMLVGQLCEAMVDQPTKYPAERFHMKPSLRKEAVDALAKGLDKSGKVDVPWWVLLALPLGISGFANWQLVKAARKEKMAEKARTANANRAASGTGAPLHPNEIRTKEGTVVMSDPAANAAPASEAHQAKAQKVYGQCRECGNPLHKRGKVYCSQRCAGLGTSKKRHNAPIATDVIPTP